MMCLKRPVANNSMLLKLGLGVTQGH